MEAEIKSLSDQHVIEEAPYDVCLLEYHVFCITKPNGKVRIVLDMKIVKYIYCLPNIKNVDIYLLILCMYVPLICGQMDLPKAFWHIVFHERCKRFGVLSLITQIMY